MTMSIYIAFSKCMTMSINQNRQDYLIKKELGT
jgi:hypothetical protein